jgi:hypothetical protein
MAEVPHRRWLPPVWVALTILILGLDYLTGPHVQFPVLLLVPVTAVAWFHGKRWALVLAAVLPFFRVLYDVGWVTGGGPFDEVVNALIRLFVFVAIAVLAGTVAEQQRALQKEVVMLRGILPICMFCKKIKNDAGEWERLEGYISKRSEAEFSHGMCQECAKKHYPGVFDR